MTNRWSRGLTAAARAGRFDEAFVERTLTSPLADRLDFSDSAHETEERAEPTRASLAISCAAHGAEVEHPCFGRADRPGAAVCLPRISRGIALGSAS